MSTDLKIGDPAPDFTATALGGAYGTGQTVSLRDFAGKHLVLYFYPKDDTPGCTAQACGLRDQWPDFQQLDAVIFGVSTDPLASHQAFIEKYGLPFPLLSDEAGEIVRALMASGWRKTSTARNRWAPNARPSSSDPTGASTPSSGRSSRTSTLGRCSRP